MRIEYFCRNEMRFSHRWLIQSFILSICLSVFSAFDILESELSTGGSWSPKRL